MNEFNFSGHPPLKEYPWANEIERLLNSSHGKNPSLRPFLFDLIMSLAYIDATSGIEKSIEHCSSLPDGYNSHLGFINLCSPCYERNNIWQYQKAVKPQSGALGKLSSEVILKFVENFSEKFQSVLAIGGNDYADAQIKHINGTLILAEVKSAPLITYPLIINFNQINSIKNHEKTLITSSQLKSCNSALYLHNQQIIPLGSIGSENWPFKPLVDFILDESNAGFIESTFLTWISARDAYISKEKSNKLFYLTNACGAPPIEAKNNHGWPQKEVISDSKTSAGMDRTDDIKKGIYQTLKIGATHKKDKNVKTAIISNLPAYRHGSSYIDPLIPIIWGLEEDIQLIGDHQAILAENLNHIFDYIITLENPLLRDLDI